MVLILRRLVFFQILLQTTVTQILQAGQTLSQSQAHDSKIGLKSSTDRPERKIPLIDEFLKSGADRAVEILPRLRPKNEESYLPEAQNPSFQCSEVTLAFRFYQTEKIRSGSLTTITELKSELLPDELKEQALCFFNQLDSPDRNRSIVLKKVPISQKICAQFYSFEGNEAIAPLTLKPLMPNQSNSRNHGFNQIHATAQGTDTQSALELGLKEVLD
ncbi:MAG: hypothetical protein ACO3A2_02170 [Bdellovibrionia bacterium]